MAIGTSTSLAGGAADPGLLPAPDAPVRRRRLPRSPKVLIGLGALAAFLLIAVIGPWIAPYSPSQTFSTTVSFPQSPSAAHVLGTTQLQQDVLSQLLAGGRSTVLVAFVAGVVATVLSVIIGVTAGYAGGLADDLLSMLANFFLVMPALPLLIVVVGFLGPAQGNDDLLIGLIIALTGWAWGARVLRAQTLSLRSRDYVESARIVGERGWQIITFEILPNLIPILASSFLFTVLYGVGTYTALAFLGLVNPNHWSWGGMLFYAQVAGAEQSGYWWLFIPPGLAVAFLGTALALVNFGIDEFINPRLRAAGLSRRRARRAGLTGAARPPRRFVLGVTPVVRSEPLTAVNGSGSRQFPERHEGRADLVAPGQARTSLARKGPEMSARPALLEVRGLCVNYGAGPDAVRAVTGADLELHAGEVLGLAGESGSGKSTLAYAITRLLRAPGMITGGSVTYHPDPSTTVDLLAADEGTLRVLRWSQISVVLQSAMNALNPVLTIRSQLTDVLQAHRRGMSSAERRDRAAELLAMVGITADRLGSYPHQLSGGMRQRVMIAMALALEPQIVIMDEPTTALDVVTQREILEELMALRERLGFAVLFITHDLSLLIEIADSIAVMYAGRVVERADATALFRAPRHPYSLGLLTSFPPLHGARRQMTGIPGSPPDLTRLPAGCVFHPRCSYVMDRCRTEEPPLLQLSPDRARVAACWLQDGTVPVPAELAAQVPGAGLAAAPGSRP